MSELIAAIEAQRSLNPNCVGRKEDFYRTVQTEKRHIKRPPRSSRKLSNEQIREIRSFKGIKSQRALGKMYGVSDSLIAGIHDGTQYADVEEAK